MTNKTNNEQASELYYGMGFDQANCYQCRFFKRTNAISLDGSCQHTIATLAVTIAKAKNKSLDVPNIPLVHFDTPDFEEIMQIPACIPHEDGLEAGKFNWPVNFDPTYLLFCGLYMARVETELKN